MAAPIATLLLMAPFLTVVYWAANVQHPIDVRRAALKPQFEAEFTGLVQFLQARNGPALCESLLACYEAGKPEIYDPYLVSQLLETGKVREDEILRMIGERHFAVVQTDVVTGVDPLAVSGHDRFSPAFMTQLLANYQMSWRTPNFAAFVPRR
jgi:hypothetical protein